jgi:hypothetical protein
VIQDRSHIDLLPIRMVGIKILLTIKVDDVWCGRAQADSTEKTIHFHSG